MSGYLRFHGATPELQAIADAINHAGDSYHHTGQWQDDDDYLDGRSHCDAIQAAALAARPVADGEGENHGRD